MALMDTVIITPWVIAADDPNQESPSNHPKLIDDYRHQIESQVALVEEKPTLEGALVAAEAAGPLFRNVLGMRAQLNDFGIGVRAPVDQWEQLKAEASAEKRRLTPWLMGPSADPTEDQFEIEKISISAVTEGVRLFEDKTGQPTSEIPPVPNQYSIRAIMEESVLQLIEDDTGYWYLTGITMQPDDPEADPIPPSPLELPPSLPMTPERQQQYNDWQQAQGAPAQFVDDLMHVLSGTDDPTHGQVTVATVTWQSELTKSGPNYTLPTQEAMEEMAKKLRYFAG